MEDMLSSAQTRGQQLAQAIRDARLASRRDPEETAAAVGVTLPQYQSYENGEQAPALPTLELLAFFLNTPVERLLAAAEPLDIKRTLEMKEQYQLLRNRVIAVRLRLARAEKNLTPAEVAAAAGVEEDQLRRQEAGQEPLPLPELEQVCLAVGITAASLLDDRGLVGKWRAQAAAVDNFLSLPSEVQAFLCQPVNLPYIHLAMRLSQLSVERLRSIAEGLLEITY